MTGYTRNAIIHHGRLDPDIDLLTKPFTADALDAQGPAHAGRQARAAKQAEADMPLRSRITTDGLDRTPHRAFMRAMGLDDAAIAKPMIGVVSQKGETTPCNMTHGPQVDAAKEGVEAAGGTPREFTTISVSDGIGMNHEGMKFSLVSRELIADSIEAVVQGHAYDGARRVRRLRQDAARRHDGARALQRAGRLRLWRRRAARPLRGPRRDRARRL